jgi:hypothetical protein
MPKAMRLSDFCCGSVIRLASSPQTEEWASLIKFGVEAFSGNKG